jgi:hypothetical protein
MSAVDPPTESSWATAAAARYWRVPVAVLWLYIAGPWLAGQVHQRGVLGGGVVVLAGIALAAVALWAAERLIALGDPRPDPDRDPS